MQMLVFSPKLLCNGTQLHSATSMSHMWQSELSDTLWCPRKLCGDSLWRVCDWRRRGCGCLIQYFKFVESWILFSCHSRCRFILGCLIPFASVSLSLVLCARLPRLRALTVFPVSSQPRLSVCFPVLCVWSICFLFYFGSLCLVFCFASSVLLISSSRVPTCCPFSRYPVWIKSWVSLCSFSYCHRLLCPCLFPVVSYMVISPSFQFVFCLFLWIFQCSATQRHVTEDKTETNWTFDKLINRCTWSLERIKGTERALCECVGHYAEACSKKCFECTVKQMLKNAIKVWFTIFIWTTRL